MSAAPQQSPGLPAVLDRAIERARSAGATACDTVYVEYESSYSAVRLGEVEKVKLSRERRLGLRCFVDHSSAVAATADLEPEQLDRFVLDTVAMARAVVADPASGLPADELLARDRPDLDLADASGLSLTPEERIEIARTCEAAALGADKRIGNSEGAEFAATSGRVAYASSRGFQGTYRTTSYTLSVAPVASENGSM
ncbi:MAG TPA: DNA gyrase modulator, partial [Candidatus Bathyarchaeia archaeon]|nr:DNA gyrase modulator [Candidatus Bathyarchaeia archaeon]